MKPKFFVYTTFIFFKVSIKHKVILYNYMLRAKCIKLFLALALLSCKEESVLTIVEPFSPGTLNKLSKAPDIGVGSVSIGVGTTLGFAGIGAVGFPPVSGGNNRFYVYNSNLKSWDIRTTLPQPYRYQSLTFATSGKLYVVGGYNYFIEKIGPPVQYKAAYYKDVWQYDVLSDTWTKKNDLPIDSASFQKCIFMNIGNRGFLMVTDKMWEYNEPNDTWILKQNLPFTTSNWDGRSFVRSGNYGMFSEATKGYVHSGDLIWEYDTETDKWKQLSSLSLGYRILFCIKQKGYYGKDTADNDSTYLWEVDFEKGTTRKKMGFPKAIGATTYIGMSYALNGKGYFSIEYRSFMKEFYEFTP